MLIGGPGDQIQGNGPTTRWAACRTRRPACTRLFTDGFSVTSSISAPTRARHDRLQRQRHDHDHPDAERLRLGCRGRGRLGRQRHDHRQQRDNASPAARATTSGRQRRSRLRDRRSGNDHLNENRLDSCGRPLVSAATSIFGNGADAFDGGPGADDVFDYSARTTRTVVNLGLISWFNDGADPNFDGFSNECDDVFATTENVLSGPVTTCSRPTTSTTSPTTSSPTRGNDQAEGGAGNDIMHIGPLRRAGRLRGRRWSDEYDGSSAPATSTVTNDGNSNDGEAGEGDNTWATFQQRARRLTEAAERRARRLDRVLLALCTLRLMSADHRRVLLLRQHERRHVRAGVRRRETSRPQVTRRGSLRSRT